MALERGTFASATAIYPLPAATTNPTLQDADPALNIALAYWRQMLTVYMGARWTAEMTALGFPTSVAASPVAVIRAYDPIPYLKEVQQLFPMLAAWRVSSKEIDRTAQLDARVSTLSVAWILPPLAAAQMERIAPLLKASLDILDNRTDYHPDPNYNDGVSPWITAQVDDIHFDSARFGSFIGDANMVFPAMNATVFMTERTMPVVGAYPPLTGTDVDVSEASQSPPFDPLVAFQTNNS